MDVGENTFSYNVKVLEVYNPPLGVKVSDMEHREIAVANDGTEYQVSEENVLVSDDKDGIELAVLDGSGQMDTDQRERLDRLKEQLLLDRKRWQEQYLADADRQYERHLRDVKSYYENLGRKVKTLGQREGFLAPWLIDSYYSYKALMDEGELPELEAVKEFTE